MIKKWPNSSQNSSVISTKCRLLSSYFGALRSFLCGDSIVFQNVFLCSGFTLRTLIEKTTSIYSCCSRGLMSHQHRANQRHTANWYFQINLYFCRHLLYLPDFKLLLLIFVLHLSKSRTFVSLRAWNKINIFIKIS